MKEYTKWNRYLGVSLLLFGEFLLEYFAILVIEMSILRFDISNYTAVQRSIHHLIMVIIWLFVTAALLYYSRKHFQFPIKREHKKISSKNRWSIFLCLICCKIMTFIDWHTLKVIGELSGKTVFQFCAQYMYYLFEVGLVLLIILYGQKSIETLLAKETSVPYGGIILALTWGAFHFVSRGVGIELWNGISCMIFSLLAGIMYLKLDRKLLTGYLLIAIGYLL